MAPDLTTVLEARNLETVAPVAGATRAAAVLTTAAAGPHPEEKEGKPLEDNGLHMITDSYWSSMDKQHKHKSSNQ